MPLSTQSTSFTRDVLGRYTANLLDPEVKDTQYDRFDVIVIGGGSFGGAIAARLSELSKRYGHRILVLEGGPFVLPEHIQNLPPMSAKFGGPAATTLEDLRNEWRRVFGTEPPALLDRNLVEPGVEVWGLPWHARAGARAVDPRDKRCPGLAYCLGGRSLFWGGWSPELIDSELSPASGWPPEVVTDLKNRYYPEAKRQLGTEQTNDFIFGGLHNALRQRLFNGLAAVIDALRPAAEEGLEAPLAVQSTPSRPGFFPFNKFSSMPLLMRAAREAERLSPSNDFNKRLMVVPNCHVIRLDLDSQQRVNRIRTNLGDISVRANTVVIIALGTIESTRLALNSFPNPRGLMGANLVAHLRSNTTIRIPRSSFPGLPNDLQASALFVKGRTNTNRHFHLQITACGVQGNITDSEFELNKKIPDIDGLDAFAMVTDDFVVVTLRGIGEMEANRQGTGASRIELDPEQDEHGVRRALVTFGLTQGDEQLWNAMDAAAVEAAGVLAGGSQLEFFKPGTGWQTQPHVQRDGLGTTHHEGGTLWMGLDPSTSVTNTYGRFHEVSNAYAVGPALFPSVGSPNPMLGGVALLRRTADHLAPPHLRPAPDPGFTTLFDGTSTSGWQMAGPGRFVLENLTDDRGQAYGVLRSEGGMGLFWFATKTFKNFILRLEWRTTLPDENSGVFVRFPDPGNDPWVAVSHGYEIQIDDYGRDAQGQPGDPLATTGAIYGFAAPSHLASRMPRVWNTYEIRVEGQQYLVALNGEAVTDFTGSRSLEGHVGIQNHNGAVFFRNVRLKELPSP